jgi:hypothetical protein
LLSFGVLQLYPTCHPLPSAHVAPTSRHLLLLFFVEIETESAATKVLRRRHSQCSFVLNLLFGMYCRPDGKKKAYVRLTADYDALDVANKIGII